MTIFKPRCPALHPDNNSRCGREEGHDDPHRNFTEKEWDDMNTRHSIDPQDTDGGTVTAAIKKEALRMPEEIPFSDFLGRLSIASHRAEQAEKNAEHYRTLAKKAEDRADKAESKLGEAVRLECPDPDAHWRIVEAFERAEKAEEERSDARHEVLALRDDLARAEAINHEITDEMLTRARAAYPGSDRPSLYRALIAALTEPQRPHGAEAIEAAFGTWEHAEYLNGGIDEDDKRALANHIAHTLAEVGHTPKEQS